jgi:hypothetical protein
MNDPPQRLSLAPVIRLNSCGGGGVQPPRSLLVNSMGGLANILSFTGLELIPCPHCVAPECGMLSGEGILEPTWGVDPPMASLGVLPALDII